MSDKFEVVNDAEIEAKIKDAQEALAKDASAPREISVTVKFHKHEEYPKVVYKGEVSKVVADSAAEADAAKDGFGALGAKPKPMPVTVKPAPVAPVAVAPVAPVVVADDSAEGA